MDSFESNLFHHLWYVDVTAVLDLSNGAINRSAQGSTKVFAKLAVF